MVKAHFGSDPKILATFGLGSPRKASRALPKVVIEEVILLAKERDATATVAVASSVSDRDFGPRGNGQVLRGERRCI